MGQKRAKAEDEQNPWCVYICVCRPVLYMLASLGRRLKPTKPLRMYYRPGLIFCTSFQCIVFSFLKYHFKQWGNVTIRIWRGDKVTDLIRVKGLKYSLIKTVGKITIRSYGVKI